MALGHYLPAQCDPKSTFKDILCPHPTPTKAFFSAESGTALASQKLQRKDGQSCREILGRVCSPLANSWGPWRGKEPVDSGEPEQQLQGPEAADQL